jgi:heme-degrading monooxygenase HmoA
MTHIRLWRFRPDPADEAAFLAAYGPNGTWAQLFGRDPGFRGTELWRGRDESYVTVDRWESEAAYKRFQSDAGDEYRQLDADLEGIAGDEEFLGAFDEA